MSPGRSRHEQEFPDTSNRQTPCDVQTVCLCEELNSRRKNDTDLVNRELATLTTCHPDNLPNVKSLRSVAGFWGNFTPFFQPLNY